MSCDKAFRYERVEVINHGTAPTEVTVELVCDADFADIFEVKSGRVHQRVNRRTERRGPAAKRFERDRPIDEYGFDQFGQFLFRMGGPCSLGSRSALQSAGLSGPLPFRRPARFQLVGDVRSVMQ